MVISKHVLYSHVLCEVTDSIPSFFTHSKTSTERVTTDFITVMTLFTFIDRLGLSVEYKYLPASTLSFLYSSFIIIGLSYLFLWLIFITVLLLFQLFRHEHTSHLQDVS